MKYEKPDLEELELVLEGSFLQDDDSLKVDPTNPDIPVEGGEGDEF